MALFVISGGVFAACSVLPKSNFVKDEDMILLASMPESDIYLYANAQNTENGLYKEFLLRTGSSGKRFMWENTENESWKPILLSEDLTGDNKKELIVKLVFATGTNTHAESIHILNIDTSEEFKIQSIDDIINANTKIKTYENAYEVVIDDMAFVIDKSALDSPIQHLFDRPVFQNYFGFEVKDNKLLAKVLLQVSPSEFAGEFIIEYTHQGYGFIMKSITFSNKDSPGITGDENHPESFHAVYSVETGRQNGDGSIMSCMDARNGAPSASAVQRLSAERRGTVSSGWPSAFRYADR
jgi:hypothetical protein